MRLLTTTTTAVSSPGRLARGLLPATLLASSWLLFAGCSGEGGDVAPLSPPETPPGTPAGPVVETGTVIRGGTGGQFVVEDPASPIAGVRVSFPADALQLDTEIRPTVEVAPEQEATSMEELLAASPGLLLELAAGHGMDGGQGAEGHPLWSPVLGATRAKQRGPILRLEPSGTRFERPVEITMPLARLDLSDPPNGAEVLVLRGDRDEHGSMIWSVLRDATIDRDAGVVRCTTDHFSIIEYLVYVGRAVVWYGSARDEFRDQNRLERARQKLPQDLYARMVEAIYCSGVTPSVDAASVPAPLPVLYYLARATDSDLETEKRLLAEHLLTGRERELQAWVMSKRPAKQKPDGTVTVVDLFGKAITLTSGDVFQALLLCHNTLRGHDGTNRNNLALQGMMAPLRGDGGDERGGRYHLFGTAVYGFVWQSYLQSERRREAIEQSVITANVFAGGEATLDPENVVELEEAIVSGTVVSDPEEYAIDLMGTEIGRRMCSEVLASEPAKVLAALGRDPGSACLEAATYDLVLAEWEQFQSAIPFFEPKRQSSRTQGTIPAGGSYHWSYKDPQLGGEVAADFEYPTRLDFTFARELTRSSTGGHGVATVAVGLKDPVTFSVKAIGTQTTPNYGDSRTGRIEIHKSDLTLEVGLPPPAANDLKRQESIFEKRGFEDPASLEPKDGVWILDYVLDGPRVAPYLAANGISLPGLTFSNLPTGAKHTVRKVTRAPKENKASFAVDVLVGDGIFGTAPRPSTFGAQGQPAAGDPLDPLGYITVNLGCAVVDQGRLSVRLHYRRRP